MLSSRGSWRGAELAGRFEVTERTLRRDITRLRGLGYPVEATTGPYGGYSLGAGGRLPPLLLDDDEAVCVAVALHGVARGSAPGMADSALGALTKLGQVMPAPLRERVAAFGEVSVGVGRGRAAATQPAGVESMMVLALACRRNERIRFDYRTGEGTETSRHAEPFRLVSLGRHWYLVALDLDRADWRTFRVDRVSRVRVTGARFVRGDVPDAAALVAEGVAVRAYAERSVLRVFAAVAEVAAEVSPTVGVVSPDPEHDGCSLVELGGDADWVARFAVSLPMRFEVVEPDSLRDELHRLGARLVEAFGAGAITPER